jgi:hypothetical protein
MCSARDVEDSVYRFAVVAAGRHVSKQDSSSLVLIELGPMSSRFAHRVIGVRCGEESSRTTE